MHYPPGLKRKAPQINLPYPRTNKDIIYEYFIVDTTVKGSQQTANCKYCDFELTIIIGSNVYSSYTSGMNWHLRNHPDQWQHFLEALGRTIKPDIKTKYQHYQAMNRVNVNYNSAESSKMFREANLNFDLNKKHKNCAGVCYIPRDCEVLKGKVSDHAVYDISEIMRYLHKFTNKNVHIF